MAEKGWNGMIWLKMAKNGQNAVMAGNGLNGWNGQKLLKKNEDRRKTQKMTGNNRRLLVKAEKGWTQLEWLKIARKWLKWGEWLKMS